MPARRCSGPRCRSCPAARASTRPSPRRGSAWPPAMAGAIGHDAFGNTPARLPGRQRCRQLRRARPRGPLDRPGADPGRRRRQCDHRRLRRQPALHQRHGARPPARGRGLGRAVRDAARDDARPADAGASRRRPHGAQPGAVRAPPCPPAEMRRCRGAERDRARPGDRRQGARREQPAPRRRGLREAAAAWRPRRDCDARRARRGRGDGRRPDRHSRLSRPRSSTRPAPATASSARWPPGSRQGPRRSRRPAMPAPLPPAPWRSWARRPRCRRPRKLRRGWPGPKSSPWSKNSSVRTPISKKPMPR